MWLLRHLCYRGRVLVDNGTSSASLFLRAGLACGHPEAPPQRCWGVDVVFPLDQTAPVESTVHSHSLLVNVGRTPDC